MGSGRYPGQRYRRPENSTQLKPTGHVWTEYRRTLFAKWSAAPGGLRCFYCGEPVLRGPRGEYLGEIEHRISWRRAPELAWSEFHPDGQRHLVPVHAGGAKRSPRGGLACNAIAGSNTAERDELGRPLPFSAAYLAEKITERAAHVARGGRPRGTPLKGTGTRPAKSPAATVPPRPAGLPAWAVDVQDDGRYRCDKPQRERGRVTDETPGSGCQDWHNARDPADWGRCW